MELIVLLTYFFVYITSTNSLLEDANQNIYNSIRVDFPFDPCDTSEISLPDYNAPDRRVSEVKCFEYIWQLRYYQGIDSRKIHFERLKGWFHILGGHEAEYGEYPHMSAIGWKGIHGTWIFKCGGSLISDRFVLTAAHCSQVSKSDTTVSDQKPKIVRLGSKNILDFDPSERNKPAYDVAIKNFIINKRYEPPRQYYDIALIELDGKVPFGWRIHPSCLWTKFENPETGTLTGWGVIDVSTRKSSPVLQKADIQMLDYEECDQKLKGRRNRNWGGFMRHQLCAGNMTGGVDTCQGDSGGPLQSLIPLEQPNPVLRWNLYHIIGVTSFGFGCAQRDTPGVYTRVASFVDWIERTVWPDNFKPHNSTNDDRFYFAT